jgi:putative membrane protein
VTAAIAVMLGGLASSPALAHSPSSAVETAPTLGSAWTLDPWLLVPLLLALLLQLVGVTRLWRRGAAGISPGAVLATLLGWLCLLLALVWPLDAFGEWSLAAHMAQHMLLMAFVPPLLLLGLPPAILMHALPHGASRRAGGLLRLFSGAERWGGSTAVTLATLLQAAVMWGWHWPPLMQQALHSDPVHYLMHGSFLLAGLLFWWCVLQSLRAAAIGYLGGVAALLAAMMQMGLMGGLLTFSPRVLYPFYVGRVEQLGLSALADQQLAGLIMWVPASLPYLIGGLWLLQRWLQRLEQRA